MIAPVHSGTEIPLLKSGHERKTEHQKGETAGDLQRKGKAEEVQRNEKAGEAPVPRKGVRNLLKGGDTVL